MGLCLLKKGVSVAYDNITSDQGGGGVVDELDDDLAHLHVFLKERSPHAFVAGEAGYGRDDKFI